MRQNTQYKTGQSLIEIIIAIALAAFFMGMTVISLSFTSTKYNDYIEEKGAYTIITTQKPINEQNLGKFLTLNKNITNWSTNDAVLFQGAHQTYTALNYITDVLTNNSILNEEKKFFLYDKPVAYWSLDGVPTSSTYILDDSANKNFTGTLSCFGSPCSNPYIISPSLSRCVHNDCLQFSGDSNGASAITFLNNTTLNNMTKITWEAWIYPTVVSNDQMFLSKQGANYFRILSNKAFVSFNIDGVQKTLSGNTTLLNNTWYHLAASFDGSTIKLYVNGILDATPLNYNGDLNFDTGLLYFGLWTSADKRPFNGYMDEIRIYNYALNNTEILNHYKALREQIGMLGYWHFDDALGIGTYNEANDIGAFPRFKTYSVPDNLAFSTQLVSAENKEGYCKQSSCLKFTNSYASKGIFSDSDNNYPSFHAPKYLTLEMWINPSSLENIQGLLTKNSANNYKTYLNGSNIVFSLKIGDTQYTETYAAGLETEQWYLLDFTYDGTNMKIYINGDLKQSWTHPGTIADDTNYNDIYLGWTGSGTEYFNGYIDELRMYKRALSSDEINNRYDGAITYYQYFKPVCKIDETNNVLDSECINCLPINESECQTTKSHNLLDPLLTKTYDVTKWGKGINYHKIEIKQIETPLVAWNPMLSAEQSTWASGVGLIDSGACQEFHGLGQRGDIAGPDNCACGVSECCNSNWQKISDAKICEASNISFYASNGCNNCGYEDEEHPGVISWCNLCYQQGYFRMTDPNQASAYFISQTYVTDKNMALLRFSLAGTPNGGKIKIQFACKDSITDENGDLIQESEWEYFGANAINSARCSPTDYYDISTPDTLFSPSSCWETDNLSLYNCKFFRYKITLEPSVDHVSPIVESINFVQGKYIK